MKLRSTGQTALPIDILREPDRNFSQGGRSFYFFDFDDNIIHLNTKIILFHKVTGEEKAVSTTEYALIHPLLADTRSAWSDFEVREHGQMGSYRNFREQEGARLQPLVKDMIEALEQPYLEWRGPSWPIFVHAVYNNRPISIITARGHHPFTVRRAIDLLVQSRDLDADPNYLSLYPVSHGPTRTQLGDAELTLSTAQLKKIAIKRAVEDAFACYGYSPFHRFGMSDDDPANVALIAEAMRELKIRYPDNAFYVINTHGRQIMKEEILMDGQTRHKEIEIPQISIFEDFQEEGLL